MKYRKKPVVIEAVRLPLDQSKEVPEWFIRAGAEGRIWTEDGGKTRIRTLEGVMLAGIDDWIIQGVKGEIYPCKPDIFAATYEPVEPPTPGAGEG